MPLEMIFAFVVGGLFGYAMGHNDGAYNRIRPLVREYKDETAKRAKLREASRGSR